MRADTDLGPGADVVLHDPQARGWSGRLSCHVERFEPHQVLSYRAVEVDVPSSTTLQWTLTPVDGGTSVHLEHAGWEGLRGWFVGMALKVGWASLLAKRLPAALGAHHAG